MRICNQCETQMQVCRIGNHLSPFRDENGDARINVYLGYECPECGNSLIRRISFVHDSTWDWDLDKEEYDEEVARIEGQAKE